MKTHAVALGMYSEGSDSSERNAASEHVLYCKLAIYWKSGRVEWQCL